MSSQQLSGSSEANYVVFQGRGQGHNITDIFSPGSHRRLTEAVYELLASLQGGEAARQLQHHLRSVSLNSFSFCLFVTPFFM